REGLLITRETEAKRLARYAKRDVLDKLGIQEGQAIRVFGNAGKTTGAGGEHNLVARISAKVNRRFVGPRAETDMVLYWPSLTETITAELKSLKANLRPAGAIWVISAKK